MTDLKTVYASGSMEVPIRQGIDLYYKNGEYVAVMGLTGCQKNVLANIRLTVCPDLPAGGQVTIKARGTSTIRDNELAELRGSEIGFVFQNCNFIPHLCTCKNAMLPVHSGKEGSGFLHLA